MRRQVRVSLVVLFCCSLISLSGCSRPAARQKTTAADEAPGPAGRGFMCVPRHRDLSSGVERAIVKWFLKLGIVVALVAGAIAILG